MSDPQSSINHIYVSQGEIAVSSDLGTVFETLLGSCVSLCLFDPDQKIGGMNHLLLPSEMDQDWKNGEVAHSVETLVNPMMRLGAKRSKMIAKVFGGGNFSGAFGNLGQKNSDHILNVLRTEGIKIVGKNLGGTLPQKVRFWPGTGRAQSKFVNQVIEHKTREHKPVEEIELF